MSAVEKIYQYHGATLEVTRNSGDSAKVNLRCGYHEHQEFIVGLMEHAAGGWVVGRKEAGYPHKGNFGSAVEQAAKLLFQECAAMGQLNDFFVPA